MTPVQLFEIFAPIFLPLLFVWFLPNICNAYRRSHLASQRGAMTLLGSGVNVPEDWMQYVTQNNDAFEIIHRPLWDTQSLTTTQSAPLNFFATQQATLDLGNEIFPLKNSYLIASIGLFFKDIYEGDNLGGVSNAQFTSRSNDHVLVTNTGILTITINGKSYGDWPMFKLASGCGVWGIMAGGGTPVNANYANIGVPDPRAMFKLAVPLVLPANTKATIVGTWPGGALSLAYTSKLACILDGKEAIAR